jgi:hypothetical protein
VNALPPVLITGSRDFVSVKLLEWKRFRSGISDLGFNTIEVLCVTIGCGRNLSTVRHILSRRQV